MEILIRYFLLLLIGFMFTHAEDTILMNAHIRMIPKIMALDTTLSHKNPIILAIVYDDGRKAYAQKVADEIIQHHNGKVTNISFSTIVLSVDELITRRDVTFAYLIQSSAQSTKKVASWGISNSIPTFSYDVNGLEFGILGSIAIERSTVIYINKEALKLGKFRFNDTLFQLARLTE
jgi:hypothetical protein